MSTDANKELVRRFYQAVDAGDTAAVPELFDSAWRNVDPSLPPMEGLDGARALIGMLKAGFPDFSSRIELIAAEDERVAVRACHTGTHQGDFMGVPPTGRPVTIHATGIFTCKDGKLIQNQVVFDAFGLLQQIGVIPA
ncbi:MAG: ester cyclase [Chloroflexi bacterium OHK40]